MAHEDNVIHLFGGEVPAAEGSEKVERFVDEFMGDFMFAVEQLNQADDEDEFVSAKDEVERIVAAWPRSW